MQQITTLVEKSMPSFFENMNAQIKNHLSTCLDIFNGPHSDPTIASGDFSAQLCDEFFRFDEWNIRLQILRVNSNPYPFGYHNNNDITGSWPNGCNDAMSNLFSYLSNVRKTYYDLSM